MPPTNRRIIDAHTHLDPAYLDQAVRFMDQNGIERAIDVSPNLYHDLPDKLRAFAAYPGRLYACTGVDPADFGTPAWAGREREHLARAAEMGAVGVKFNKRWGLVHQDAAGQVIPPDHEALDPLYDQAGRLGLTVCFHLADPKAFFRPIDERNERYEELHHNPDWCFADREKYPYDWWTLVRMIEKVVGRHPGTRFVGAHFGCAAEEIGYVAGVMRDHPNYAVDTAARVGELGRYEPDYVRRLFLEFQDRILFGTDLGVDEDIMLGAPQAFEPGEDDVKAFFDAHWRYFETTARGVDHPTPIQGNWKVDAIGLPVEVLHKLYRENAKRWYLKAE